MNSRDAPPPVLTWSIRVAEPEASHGGRAVTATHHRKAGTPRHRVGDRAGPGRERRHLEHAHRPVPEEQSRVSDLGRERVGGLGPDVEPLHVRRHPVRRDDARLGVVRDLLGHDDVGRDADAPGFEEPPALFDHLRFHERVPDRVALCEEEREHHRPADEDRVAAFEERVDDAELVAHLRAAEHRHEGMLPRLEQARQRLDLLEEQPAAGTRKDTRRPHDRGVRPMRRAERLVHVGVGELAQVRREGGIVGRLAPLEAQVLQHDDAPPASRLATYGSTAAPTTRWREGNLLSEQLAQARRYGRHRILRVRRALRSAEVPGNDDGGVLLAEPLERR